MQEMIGRGRVGAVEEVKVGQDRRAELDLKAKVERVMMIIS
jgi:hypothetical protein